MHDMFGDLFTGVLLDEVAGTGNDQARGGVFED